MPILEAIVLGIVQGLTEFLPVSSTAHLALVPWLVSTLGLANWPDPGLTFDVALHAGTLFAILLYFWRTWIQIIRAALGGKVVRFSEVRDDVRDLTPAEEQRERQLLWFMIAATIPAALAGALLEKHIETTFRAPALVASMLIVVAVIMWIAERMSKFEKPLPQIGLGDALTVGVMQAFAVIPGVSRSGITITGGLFRNFTREAAARFSFLLSTPDHWRSGALQAASCYETRAARRRKRTRFHRIRCRNHRLGTGRLRDHRLVHPLPANQDADRLHRLPNPLRHRRPAAGTLGPL